MSSLSTRRITIESLTLPLTPKVDGAGASGLFEGAGEGAVIEVATDLRDFRNRSIRLQ